jgi:MoaA/NifB/PqqE/SkfB family radical SAM enzyme
MYTIEQIKTIHLEITQKCQAACPMCDRNQNGGDLNPHIKLDELTLQDCKQIFTPSFISQLKKMYMCGNLGDPIIANDTLEVFEYFRQHNPNIWLNMHTNGGAQKPNWWKRLAEVIGNNGDVTFSVDGLKDTNHLYRQNVNWDIVDQSMRAFIESGGNVRWDFLIFDHNQHQIDEAKQYAESIGVKKFQAKKTGRFITTTSQAKQSHQAVNRKGKETQELKKPNEKFINKALKKQDSLLDKYGSMDAYYDKVPIWCKVKEEGSLYISAEGLALPCCWTAGRMYKWWHKDPKVEQIWDFIDNVGGKEMLDAKNGLDKVFKTGIFDLIEQSWNIDGCNNGKLKVCSMKCGKEFDPFAEQFN